MEEIYWQLIDLFHVVQGVVYWQPPRKALNKVEELVWEPSISRHGADEVTSPALLLSGAVHLENKMVNSSVMVTAGANQEQYVDDDKVVRWLATRHGVVVIPGGACGCLTENNCKAAAERRRRGSEDLVSNVVVD
ncbi:hypothetical protein NC653_008412 [Populus alba x Populus x berolinensis]|uniref:Uncharacterized protein n=1 Tax=Populus alba x Populus x berolinensis TaxID=444605 RepID=A0AAD6R6D0_9ROSI|nr:hypothetical protein NC653_008412 [Populus alba x Populus x berolinensis]